MSGEEKKTIFFVDDDKTNLTVGKNALSETYNVFTLNSGVNLLKMLDKHQPDLILLDIDMPEMDGYEVIKRIKAKSELAAIPVIFLTAKSDVHSEMEGLSLGAIDYIIKPFSPPLLRKRIEVHLLVESQRQELIRYNTGLQEMVDEKIATVVELKNAIMSTMAELVESRDETTGAHVERTQKYVKVLMEQMIENGPYLDEVRDWEMEHILQSAELHDVGKIKIRDNVLLKPGKLTEEEFEQIKKHAEYGEQIIEDIGKLTTERDFLDQAKLFAGYHHEKWDGSGYPRGLKGGNIPLQGRVMAVADVYDALVSDRPYKVGFSHEKSVSIIVEGRGSHFDPALVDLFLEVADQFEEIKSKVGV